MFISWFWPSHHDYLNWWHKGNWVKGVLLLQDSYYFFKTKTEKTKSSVTQRERGKHFKIVVYYQKNCKVVLREKNSRAITRNQRITKYTWMPQKQERKWSYHSNCTWGLSVFSLFLKQRANIISKIRKKVSTHFFKRRKKKLQNTERSVL